MALVYNPLDGTYVDDGTFSATPVAPVQSSSSFTNGYTGNYTDPYAGIGNTGGYATPTSAYLDYGSNGMSPNGSAGTVAPGQSIYAPSVTTQDPNQWLLQQQENNVTHNGATSAQILNQLSQTQGGFFTGQNQILNDSQGLADKSQSWADQLTGLDAGLAGASWNSAQNANAQDQQTLGQYTQALGNLNGLALGNYSTLANNLGSIPVLTAGGFGAPVISQAATAQADPASIAAQNSALSQLQGFANGSHALTSQAAQAYANPQDVANQEMAAGKLQDIAGGSLNVQNGSADPQAYAAAHDALNQLSALTTPQNTAAEKFILEQNRLAQEQQESASRAAIMTDMSRRGMSGSGMEIGANALAGAQTSENRLLGDLGAQAQAVQRSMQALGMYGDLSSTLNSQGNQVAEFNSGLQANAQQAASQAYATLRAQGFSEEYARGQAADAMAQFNTNVELQGSEASGQLASNMRQESFNEDFSTKSAADSVAEFNKAQSLQQQRFQDTFAADQQQQLTNRYVDIANQGNTTLGQLTTNTNNLANAQFGVTNAADQRNQSSIGTIGQLALGATNAQQNAINTGLGVNGQRLDTAASQLNAMTNLGGAIISNNNNQTTSQNGVLQNIIGYQTGQQASAAAAAAAKSSGEGGLFGTGIAGSKDPLWFPNWFHTSTKGVLNA